MDCKCRGDVGQWEKSEIAVDCKCRGEQGQWGKSKSNCMLWIVNEGQRRV